MNYFTGIGATSITPDEDAFMVEIGILLTQRGLSLRSGKAPGSDRAFQKGVEIFMATGDYIRDHQIFLPWQKFEKDNGEVSGAYDVWNFDPDQVVAAEAIVSKIHPVWDTLTRGQRLFHIRNAFQPLGLNLNEPSKLLIACSDTDAGGLPRGGTRTAYKIALDNNIPCINIRGLGRGIVMDWINNYCPEIEGESE